MIAKLQCATRLSPTAAQSINTILLTIELKKAFISLETLNICHLSMLSIFVVRKSSQGGYTISENVDFRELSDISIFAVDTLNLIT